MRAYKTYLTIQNPNKVVLSNLPFEPGQQVEIVVLANDENKSAQISELKSLLEETQSLPQVMSLTGEDIIAEIEAYRSGRRE